MTSFWAGFVSWIRKAESDLENARMCSSLHKALDTACFHAQQAAEKLLKAYPIAYGLPAPFVHNIDKLVELCDQHNPAFGSLKVIGQSLTPYAVQLRCDEDFWPTEAEAASALQAVEALRTFLIPLLPTPMQPAS